tara:strand:- start:105 stop:338 length:234 start_codon:yes stop_codon:yes gene_type:complete
MKTKGVNMKTLELTSFDDEQLILIIELTDDEYAHVSHGGFYEFEYARNLIEKRLQMVILGRFNLIAVTNGESRKELH